LIFCGFVVRKKYEFNFWASLLARRFFYPVVRAVQPAVDFERLHSVAEGSPALVL
jgi:hypothetical protein